MAGWTTHARQRAQKRFPGVNLDAAFLESKLLTKSLRRKIKEKNRHCRLSYLDSSTRGAKLMANLDAGVLFVISIDKGSEAIVTVLKI